MDDGANRVSVADLHVVAGFEYALGAHGRSVSLRCKACKNYAAPEGPEVSFIGRCKRSRGRKDFRVDKRARPDSGQEDVLGVGAERCVLRCLAPHSRLSRPIPPARTLHRYSPLLHKWVAHSKLARLRMDMLSATRVTKPCNLLGVRAVSRTESCLAHVQALTCLAIAPASPF